MKFIDSLVTDADLEREIVTMTAFAARFRVDFRKRSPLDPADFDLLDAGVVVGFAEVRTKRESIGHRSWNYLDEHKYRSLRSISEHRNLPAFYLIAAIDGIFSLSIHKLEIDALERDMVGRVRDNGLADRKFAYRVPARFWIKFSDVNVWERVD